MAILSEAVKAWPSPAVTLVATRDHDPFKVLVSCILSLRTRDQTTSEASQRLFGLADTPEKVALLSAAEIEAAIYPVGFYRNKALQIREISRQLAESGGSVPDELD